MTNLTLNLSVARSFGDIKPDMHYEPNDTEFTLLKQQRLEQDNYTCAYCGWIDKLNHIDHLNDDHADNDISNLVTCCALCHACKHIGYSSAKGNGVLIKMGFHNNGSNLGFSQVSLNHLMRVIFVINKIGTDKQKQFAMTIWKRLQLKSKLVSQAWGTNNPELFTQKLLLLPNESYHRRNETFFKNICILFTPNSPFIAKALPSWCEQLNNPPPDKWEEILLEFED